MSAEEFKARPTSGPQLDPRLLEVLVCPLTKCTLVYHAEKQELLSRKAGLAYPIRNGVPLMTVEAARQLSDEEIAML
jgi:hypothetical protein